MQPARAAWDPLGLHGRPSGAEGWVGHEPLPYQSPLIGTIEGWGGYWR